MPLDAKGGTPTLIIDRRFKVGVPPFVSNEASKSTSKPPANIALWLSIFSKLHSIAVSSLRTLSCSFFVLALLMFISKKSKPSARESKKRIHPFF